MSSPLSLVADEARTCVRCRARRGPHPGRVRHGRSRTPTSCSWARARAPKRTARALPFVGRSGKLLDQLLLEEIGLTARPLLHRQRREVPAARQPRPASPTRSPPAGRGSTPSSSLIAPKVVVTLGNFATKLLLDTTDGITKLRGRTYPFGDGVLVPTFHPAAVLRGGAEPHGAGCGPTSCGPSWRSRMSADR